MSKRTQRIAYWVVDVTGGWGVAACKEGEGGYHPVPEYGPYPEESRAQGVVDRLNLRAGLGPTAVRGIVRSTMPQLAPPELTAAQQRVLKRMPDRPSDGVLLKGGSYMAALTCVEKGWAVMVGRREVGGNFARLPAGRAVLRLDDEKADEIPACECGHSREEHGPAGCAECRCIAFDAAACAACEAMPTRKDGTAAFCKAHR